MKLSTIAIATSAALSVSVFAADATIQPVHQGYSETAPYYEVDGKVISNTDIHADLWNPRGKTKEQIIERSIFLAEKYDLERTEVQLKRAQKAQQDYVGSIVINSVMPSAVGIIGNTEEHYAKGLKRNRDAGVDMASTTVFAFNGDGDMPILERIEKSTKVISELGMEVVKDTDTIRQAKDEGKMAVMFNSQGADYVIEDLDMLKKVKLKGLHAANFTYNRNNALAGGGSKQDMGVTELGKKFIEHANANGVIVDVSHSSNQTAIDAAKYSKKPIIASHSNVAAIHDISRNMSDEAIKAVGATGGAVCTTGVGLFLNSEADASPKRYAEHVEYTANLIGRDKTCFSTDYVHNIQDYYANFIGKVDVYPPEKGFGAPLSNIAPENIWDVVSVLEDKYDWSEKDIRGFLGENLMRVYAENWN
ncbi:dipeptidase [Vibrio rotiferianus]|uniref:dipeptidase n=1 Tax=Vibrio rotiferianus TaxID=190895 RepID=UPI00406A196D